MTYLIENWPMAAGTLAFVLALIPVVRIFTGHMSHRSNHRKSQIDALQKISDIDISTLTPEQALVLDATVSYAYKEEISTKLYKVLREAIEPARAMKRFRFMRPFIELSDSENGLRFRQRRLLFRKRDSVIPTWRVTVLFSVFYLVFSIIGLTLVLLGMVAVAKGYWIWAMSLVPIGAALFGLGIVYFNVGHQFETHIKPFREATANLFET